MRVAAPDRSVILWTTAATVLVLVIKFFASLQYGVPLGYDAGMYRYLFSAYADALPNGLPDLPGWAQEHPLGLFLIAFPLLKAGVPVDWFTGWVWNVFAVGLVCALAWASGKRYGPIVGVLTLVTAALSVAYYDGFAAMYWKTYASLLFVVFAFHFLEKRPLVALPFALLALITHHQTGLLFGLSVASWWAWQLPSKWRDPLWRWGTLGLAAVAGLSLLFYFPVWFRAVQGPLSSIFAFRGDAAPAGSFPPTSYFIRMAGPLLGLGIAGFLLQLKRERGTLWQWPVVWAAAFIVLRLVFHRRFFLQLDFFLLPFAAIALRELWTTLGGYRWLLPLLVAGQGMLSFYAASQRLPAVPLETVQAIRTLSKTVPEDALIIDLENQSAWMARGHFLKQRVAAPGLFGGQWTYAQWEQFLYGAPIERRALLTQLRGPTYLLATPYFRSYYGERADAFLEDYECLDSTAHMWLWMSRCDGPTDSQILP